MTATICGCCGNEIKGRAASDSALGEVCVPCVPALIAAKEALNAEGMVGLHLGDCGDNNPPKEEAP